MDKEADFKKKIDQIANWSRSELISEYQRIYRQPPIHRISEAMLRRMIAYDWQERVHGGLCRTDQKQLERLLNIFKRNPKSIWDQVFQIKPGTKLRRVWKGKNYEVTAEENGFRYQGQSYGSISEVATLITGVRWNGHLFFGLKTTKAVDVVHEAA